MSQRKKTRIFHARDYSSGRGEPEPLALIVEDPLEVRVEDRPFAVLMRTPGEETCHAVGFCLGEGIVDDPADIARIGYDEYSDPNVIDVWLTPERQRSIPRVLERRSFVSRSSCGICGKAMIADLCMELAPSRKVLEVERDDLERCIEMLSKKQEHYRTTRGSHAALILDSRLEAISFAEDVGRHNALDKAIGKAMLDRTLSRASVLVLSSRNSHELVQKAARADIPITISNSRPTSLAVEMATSLGMTLVFPEKRGGLIAVCGDHRLKVARSPQPRAGVADVGGFQVADTSVQSS